ncbi:MAG: hypothetical protein JNL81_02450 [Hyphomonadaceae bacterium]|nr:hypothetical protein [Hyphomonadaceae bacterium]
MRAAIALAFALCLAGCLPPVNADTVEAAWERCDGPGAPDYRINQCSIVIGFAGTTPERRAAALLVRGSIRSTEGQYNRALADFGRVLRIDARNAQAYIERGIVHQARGAFDFALRDFDFALTLQPGLQLALDRRAQVISDQAARYQAELTQLDEMLNEAPNDATLLNERCWLRTVNNDNLDAALADCHAALAAENDANVLDSRGLVFYKRGEFVASLADYEAAVALQPERGHFLYGRGLARAALGMNAEAQADFARAEELEPGIGRAYETYNILPPKPPAEDAAPAD